MTLTEIIYGTNPILEMLRSGRRSCQEIFVAEGRKGVDASRVEAAAQGRGVRLKFISREELNAIAGGDKNQGIAARCSPYPYAEFEASVKVAAADPQKGFLLFLDGIEDPQNLGALVRTSSLMGVHAVILPKDNAAAVTPTVVKASAGATEHQRIVQVTNLARAIEQVKEEGFWVAGSDGASRDMLYHHDFKGHNVAIVMGAEGKGMRRLVREKCDHLLSIPMTGPIESYNVSVAGALFMGEVARQRWLGAHAKTVPNITQTP